MLIWRRGVSLWSVSSHEYMTVCWFERGGYYQWVTKYRSVCVDLGEGGITSGSWIQKRVCWFGRVGVTSGSRIQKCVCWFGRGGYRHEVCQAMNTWQCVLREGGITSKSGILTCVCWFGRGGHHHHKLRLAMNTDFCPDSRKCPLCRTQSDFVTPSQLWVETQEEKINLIQGYKTALKSVSDYPSATLILPPLSKPPSRRTCLIILLKLFFTAVLIPSSDTWMCTCIVCVCVSVIVKCPVLPPCAVDGRSRNSLYYYYYYQ